MISQYLQHVSVEIPTVQLSLIPNMIAITHLVYVPLRCTHPSTIQREKKLFNFIKCTSVLLF